MNKFIVALIAAAALVAAAVMLGSGPHNDPGERALVLPNLGNQINAISRVRVQSGEETATLVRGDDGWTVAERDYPADLGKLRTLLVQLAELEVVEPKTANPALYGRLGVQDFGTGSDDALGNVQILLWADETQQPGVLVGKTATQPRGSYVRRIGEAQSALANRVITTDANPAAWLTPALTNIAPDAITRIAATHRDGDYVIERIDDDLVLTGLADGESAKPATVARVTRVLQNLRAEDVLSSIEQPSMDGWTTLEVALADGGEAVVRVGVLDDRKLMQLELTPAPENLSAEPEPDANATPSAAFRSLEHLRGRTFVIQDYKFNDADLKRSLMIDRPDDADG